MLLFVGFAVVRFSFLLGGSCVALLVSMGLVLGTILSRFVGACSFKNSSSSNCLFSFSRIVCLALFCASWIRLCLSCFVMPCMISHISRMLILSGFIGHVHVGHVWVFPNA